MAVDLLLGLQWGDEGKGKIVDILTKSYDIIARFQGGPNAGHTLEFDGIKHVLHTIPSGIFHNNVINLIGNGVVIDPVIFKKEIQDLNSFKIDFENKLLISKKAHLILPTHRLLDAASEASKGKAKIGSTQKKVLVQLIWIKLEEMELELEIFFFPNGKKNIKHFQKNI